MTVYVVIDIGCRECGVGHELVSVHWTQADAESAVKARDAKTNRWREGGQTFAEWFRVDVPVGWCQ